MIPARSCFQPDFLNVDGIRLRTACFAVDPERSPRGVCVLLNGQTEFIEKYFEVIDELRGRGFAVATLDWRGQGGSSRLVPDNPLKAHIDDFSQYDSDLDAFMAQIVTPMLKGGRLIALTHSMGGHILLRHLHRQPGVFAAAAFSAPMLMFSTRGQPRWLVHAVTRWMIARGRATEFVWGMQLRDPLKTDFSLQIVTSDRVRFQRTKDFLMQHPDLRLAGPTWGWVAAASRAVTDMAAPGYAEAIATHVLVCGAGRDRVVVSEAEKRFTTRVPAGRYYEIADAEHEILMERNEIRQDFWRAFDRLIEQQI